MNLSWKKKRPNPRKLEDATTVKLEKQNAKVMLPGLCELWVESTLAEEESKQLPIW